VGSIPTPGTKLLGHLIKGIVAEPADGRYYSDATSTNWVKIKDRNYTQATGRHKLFETRRRRTPRKHVPLLRVGVKPTASRHTHVSVLRKRRS
jgi:hypothetical protein